MYDFKICRNDQINLKWYEYVIHWYIMSQHFKPYENAAGYRVLMN